MKKFDPGWKLTQEFFLTSNIETKGVESWPALWNFDHETGSKFNNKEAQINLEFNYNLSLFN